MNGTGRTIPPPITSNDNDDAMLMQHARNGSREAYAVLYRRHVDAARRLARLFANSTHDADDLVSQAFTAVLAQLDAGRGPTTAFRAYLFTAMRHAAYDRTRADRRHRVEPFGDPTEIPTQASPASDELAITRGEQRTATWAFTQLPARWQAVLRCMDIGGMNPRETAVALGISSPNAASALGYRARRALREIYYQRQDQCPPKQRRKD